MKKEFTKQVTSIALVLFALFTLSANAQMGAPDRQYYKGQGVDFKCTGGLVLPDSSIIITGKFAYVNQTRVNGLVKLFADGSIDNSFNVGTGANDHVNVIVRQPDGKLLIAGDFTVFNGTTVNRIARLNPDGSMDATFLTGTGFNNSIYTLNLQADGKILAGGMFTTFNGASAGRIIRLNSDGTRDNSFICVPGASAAVYAIDHTMNDQYIVAGDFTSINGNSINRIVRLNSTGTVDGSFNPGTGTNSIITSAVVLPNQQIILGGYFSTYNGTTSKRIARIMPDGLFDSTFAATSAGFNNNVNDIAVQPDGKILAVGGFTSYNGTTLNRIARLDSNGVRDASFKIGAGADLSLNAVFLNPDGKIYLGGTFTSIDSFARIRIARLNPNGTTDRTFVSKSQFNGAIWATGFQSNGLAIVAGNMTTHNKVVVGRIARLDLSGEMDPTFNAAGIGANDLIRALLVQPDDKIVLVGDFTKYNNVSCNRICRLNADGTLDATFTVGSGFNASAYSVVLQPDGKVIIGGNFTSFAGTPATRIVRLNTNGTIDATFNTGSGFNNAVVKLLLQPDGKVVAGGAYTTFNNVLANRISRLNPNGSADNTFNTSAGFNNHVQSLALQTDGKIVVGGSFTSFNGYTKTRIARLNSDGSLDSTYAASANGAVLDLMYIKDGILAIGQFATANNITRNHIAYFEQTGRLDTVTFAYTKGTTTGYFISMTNNTVEKRILLGGTGNDYDGALAIKLARINAANLDLLWTSETLCPGAQFYIPTKTTNNLTAGNSYKIQLSDSTGFFSNPVTVGVKTSTASIDSVLITIPAITPEGSNYRLRVISTASADTSYCTAPFAIRTLPSPVVTASGATSFCAGSNVSITCPAALSYQWNTGVTTASLTTGNTGSYVVTATYAYGCQAVSAPLNVTVYAAPDSSISIASANLCGNAVQLQAAPGLNYQWSTGATTSSIAVNAAGTYSLLLTNSFGCKSDSSITVNPYNLSGNLIVANGPTSLCPGQSVILTSLPGLSYSWSNNQTTQSITVSSSGNYKVTVTDGSCSATSTIVAVTVNSAPNSTISASTTQLCPGNSAQLNAVNGLTYSWSTGASTASITINTAGLYTLSVTDNNGCTASSSKTITGVPLPSNTVTAGGATTICQGNSLLLTAAPGLNYLWSNGATSQTISASASGSYKVTVTDIGTNCSAASNPVNVVVKPAPTASISATATAICPAALTTLSGPANMSYHWNNGAITSSLVVGPGSYALTITDGNNCTASATQVITALNGPDTTVMLSGATEICDGETVTISAGSGSGFSYNWSNGFGSQSITVSAAGTYRATVSDAITHCMAVTSPVTITIKPVPAISYSLPADRICNTSGIIQLTNASPAGGTFFVNGWVATEVDPSQYSNSNVIVTYVYEAANGCEAYKADTVFVETCTGINELLTSGINVYPNPAHNYIVVADEQQALTRVDVIDMLGQTLLTETSTTPQGQVSLNISQLAAGNYFIVTNNKKFKFIKAE
ncbi:MAG: T9SS type A sorting domain-containing protein [Chitinophagales bacterium]